MKVVDYKKLYEGVKWERDMLQEQLEELKRHTKGRKTSKAEGLTKEETIEQLRACISPKGYCDHCLYKDEASCMEKLMAEAVKYLEEEVDE